MHDQCRYQYIEIGESCRTASQLTPILLAASLAILIMVAQIAKKPPMRPDRYKTLTDKQKPMVLNYAARVLPPTLFVSLAI